MKRMAVIAAALVLTAIALAPPVMAQTAGTNAAQNGDCMGVKGTLQDMEIKHAFTDGGTSYNNPSPLIVLGNPASPGNYTRMHVGKAENWTADVAIGEAGRCAGDRTESTNLVSFHIASHREYYPGQEVARACTYKNDGQGRGEFKPYDTGWFTVRLYGTICDTTDENGCTSFRPSGYVTHLGDFGCLQANTTGYLATFAPRPNCGPAKWPTKYLRDIGAPPYAEWCDFVVDTSK